HALRAFTPRDQKAVKTAAETMRANPAFDAATAITELGVGEALISFLDEKGRPQITERSFVIAPGSRLGPMTDVERQQTIKTSVLFGHYEKALDRESAYEMIQAGFGQAEAAPATEPSRGAPAQEDSGGGLFGGLGGMLGGMLGGGRSSRSDGIIESAAKSAARSIGTQVGRAIIRGVLGSILGGSTRRR
ncbi:MAG: DUF853 family protein, partial [Proteobacteria bacterium]